MKGHVFCSRYRKKGHWGGRLGFHFGDWRQCNARHTSTISRFLFGVGRFGVTNYWPEWAVGYRGTAIDIGPIAIHWKAS